MTAPIAVPSDLGVYLTGDAAGVDSERAAQILGLAQSLCETITSPLTSAALPVILGVAARAYSNVTSAATVGLGTAHIGYGTTGGSLGVGGLYLSRSDKSTLRRLAGRSGAFSIDLLPGAVPPTTVPNMTTVAPSQATTGALVTVTGWGFTGTTSVTLGGVTASFDVTTDVQIVVAIPAGAAGIVDLLITNAIGTSTPFPYVRS
jgi:hypothetical protein